MKLLLTCVIAVACVTSTQAQARDGNWWLHLADANDSRRLLYVAGFMDGLLVGGANVELEFFAKHTKGTQPWDEALAAYKKLENRLTSVSVRQVVDGLNEFFKDYRNRSISTEHAIDVVLKSIKGEDVEELILFYRRVGP